MTTETSKARTPLVGHLVELHKNKERGALAELRRGLGQAPGTVVRMAPHVERFLSVDASPWVQNAHYLVAALFASHRSHRLAERGAYTLGHSFRLLSKATGSDSVTARFLALLDADEEDIHVHLRHAISLLKAHDIAVDYDQLLDDLIQWRKDDRRVQRAWARAYFGGKASAEDEASDDDNTDIQN